MGRSKRLKGLNINSRVDAAGAAALVRHAPTRGRGRHQDRAGAARPCQRGDHADLHPRHAPSFAKATQGRQAGAGGSAARWTLDGPGKV